MKQIVPVIAVMVAMLSTLVYITTRTIAPDYHFELKTDAVMADVEILFDDMAVPRIYATAASLVRNTPWWPLRTTFWAKPQVPQ